MFYLFLNEEVVGVIEEVVPGEYLIPPFPIKQGDFISFSASDDNTQTHFLGNEEGFIHLSIRILDNGGCMVDCVVSTDETYTDEDFYSQHAVGIRFQPFKLDVAEKEEFRGKGLFDRGLHFSGMVTPTFVSLSCICDECQESFRLQSFNCGFSDQNYFYSESGNETLIMSSHTNGCPTALAETVDLKALGELEARLPKAQDGTSFAYMNPLRCPYCQAPYIDFGQDYAKRAKEYYACVYLGDEVTNYEET